MVRILITLKVFHATHTHTHTHTHVTNRLKRHRIFCGVSCFTVLLKRESISSLVIGEMLEKSVTCRFEFKVSEQYWSQYCYLHS
jgi:hypothetical protein